MEGSEPESPKSITDLITNVNKMEGSEPESPKSILDRRLDQMPTIVLGYAEIEIVSDFF